MNQKNKELKKYFKEIRQNLLLIYSKVQTNEMMNSIKKDIYVFIAEGNIVDMSIIKANFGEPIDFISETITKEELEKISKKTRTYSLARKTAALLLLIAIVTSTYYCALWYKGYWESHTQIVTKEQTIIE